MSISFKGSILRDVATNQVVMLDEAQLRYIIQQEFVPQNQAVLQQMQRVLLPMYRPLYDYMYYQIQKYTDEFNWILSTVHNSRDMTLTCVITSRTFLDDRGNLYTRYSLPKYADNCYEYSLRDELDKRLGYIMPYKIKPAPGVEINIYDNRPHMMDMSALMFRNPGAVCGQECDHGRFRNIGNLVCGDLQACGVQHLQFFDIASCQPFMQNGAYTVIAWIYGDNDYHFYRYEPQFGVWSHKPGMMFPRCIDAKGMVITDPRTCCWCLPERTITGEYRLYDRFGGFIVAAIPAS